MIELPETNRQPEDNIPRENERPTEQPKPPEMMAREEFVDSTTKRPLESEEWVKEQFEGLESGEPGLSIKDKRITMRDNHGQPIATALLRDFPWGKAVYTIAVKPEFRGLGLATQLYEKAVEMGYSKGVWENKAFVGLRHKYYVKEALSQGKPVYEGWQKDYPELAKEYNKTENFTENDEDA